MAAFAIVNGAGHYYTGTGRKWSADRFLALWFFGEEAAWNYLFSNDLPGTVKPAEGM